MAIVCLIRYQIEERSFVALVDGTFNLSCDILPS
jgi:hypothetical protein